MQEIQAVIIMWHLDVRTYNYYTYSNTKTLPGIVDLIYICSVINITTLIQTKCHRTELLHKLFHVGFSC